MVGCYATETELKVQTGSGLWYCLHSASHLFKYTLEEQNNFKVVKYDTKYALQEAKERSI